MVNPNRSVDIMSPHVENFVHSLVEMAKAMETLPTVQHELAEAHKTIEHQREIIQRVELKLLDRAAEISNLQASIRNLEVSRDDAELRFLEADDIASTLKNALRDVMAKIDGTLKAVEPVLPPTEVVEPYNLKEGQSTTPPNYPPPVIEEPQATSEVIDNAATSEAPVEYPMQTVVEANKIAEQAASQVANETTTSNPPITEQEPIGSVSSTVIPVEDASLGESASNPTPVETPTDVSPQQTNVETTTALPTTTIQPDGVSVSPDPIVNTTIEHPTAPPQAVSTSDVGSSQTEGSDDKEPVKFGEFGEIRQAWLEWSDRQFYAKRSIA